MVTQHPVDEALLTYEQRLVIAMRRRRRRIALATGLVVLTLAVTGSTLYVARLLPWKPEVAERRETSEVPVFEPDAFLSTDDRKLLDKRQQTAAEATRRAARYEDTTDLAAITASEFLTATSIEEKLRWVRHPERVAPLMREYHARPDTPTTPPFESVTGKAKLTAGDRDVVTITFQRQDGSTGAVLLLADDGDEQTFHVDWESFVAYSEMPLDEFLDSKPTTPTLFRLFARPADYYNYQFSDSETYQCLELTTRNPEDPILYGFVKRDTPWVEDVILNWSPLNRRRALTLNIAFPENPQADNCVLITEYLHAWWFAP